MLATLGYQSLDALIDAAVPHQIRSSEAMNLPQGRSEQQVLSALRDLAERNQTRIQMIGLGYHDSITPAVLRRNMLESRTPRTSRRSLKAASKRC
jgi:glycine dehydrogenase